MMRWWWFGPAVTNAELERELRVMKAAGIGGVEIQPVYPVELDDIRKGIRNLPYLSPEFIEALRFTASLGQSLGMRVDVTLGSGWPYGGPQTLVTEAAGQLRFERINVPEGVASVPLPSMENGESLVAAFLGSAIVHPDSRGYIRIPQGLSGGDLLTVFIASRTGQQVKRAAVGAEGFVLDHYREAAITHHLTAVADKLLTAFGGKAPYSVFSDSLEVFGSDWSSNLLDDFRGRRGYDLLPHLPALAIDTGPETEAVRHDWAKTLTELAEDNYLKPIRTWAHAHGTLFRSQTYGEPPMILSSAQFVDLPEGEHGPYWRRFSDARWASSVCHLYGRPVASTETWTWLHSPAFRATPLDLKAEADRHFLEGINQIVGHGWPYSPPEAGEPGWRFYAAAALNDHNPWFGVMPDIARYLQRLSYLLRQGKPANDIAVYLPTDDAWARLKPGSVAFDEMVDSLLGPTLIPAILNAGYNFDFIDDRAMEAVGIPYRIVVLPGVERIPLGTLNRLADYVRGGGAVVATRTIPSRAPGLLEERTEADNITSASRELFHTGLPRAVFVQSDAELASALTRLLAPDLSAGDAAPGIGFIHRKLIDADIYFIANTSNRPVQTTASIRIASRNLEYWSPFSGEVRPGSCRAVNGRTETPLELAPYESRVLVFEGNGSCKELDRPQPGIQTLDLSTGWKVTFSGIGETEQMEHLRSWTDDEHARFYSGEASYEKTININQRFLEHSTSVKLSFGAGRPVEPITAPANGMSALLDSPVRESAIVFVNAQRAGTIWCPPYDIEIKQFLRAGENAVRIVVGNLAINEMSGKPLPDYRLLNDRYGERFTPQDMQNLRPVPAGILGPVQLISE
jgi:hypothetical protein